MKAYPLSIASQSLIAQHSSSPDYQDAFGISLPASAAVPPEVLMVTFFKSIPAWARILLGIRELLASWVGLKTAAGIDVEKQLENFKGEVGDAIALFHVKDRSATEILTGETDKHLDFLLSFIGQPKGNQFEIILATTVQFNGWLGKLYFLPVKPIHRILVPAMLRRMAQLLNNEAKNL